MYKLINTLKTQDDAIPAMMDYGPSAELGDVSSKYSCLLITLYIMLADGGRVSMPLLELQGENSFF